MTAHIQSNSAHAKPFYEILMDKASELRLEYRIELLELIVEQYSVSLLMCSPPLTRLESTRVDSSTLDLKSSRF